MLPSKFMLYYMYLHVNYHIILLFKPAYYCSPNAKVEEPSDAKRQKILSDEQLKNALPEYLQRLSKKKLRKALQKPHKPMSNIETPGRGKFEMCVTCKSNARVSTNCTL